MNFIIANDEVRPLSTNSLSLEEFEQLMRDGIAHETYHAAQAGLTSLLGAQIDEAGRKLQRCLATTESEARRKATYHHVNAPGPVALDI